MTLLDTHIGFVEALRSAGLSVSLAEGLDAISALEQIGWHDREIVRTAYAATLVKRQPQRVTFDAIFDLYYPRLVGDGVAGQRAGDEGDDAEPADGPRDTGADLERFREALAEALGSGDQQACRTSPSRRSRASGRCPAVARGCRAGRRTPRSSGSRPPSSSTSSSRGCWPRA